MLSSVKAKKHPCPFPLTRNQLASMSPGRQHLVELHNHARRQAGHRAIMPASCLGSLDIPFQASSRDRLQTQVIPWQTRKGEKWYEAQRRKKNQSFSVYFELCRCTQNQHKVVKLPWTEVIELYFQYKLKNFLGKIKYIILWLASTCYMNLRKMLC